MTKNKPARCVDPLDCGGCGACVTGDYLYDDPLECMIQGEHLTDCDEDGYCNLCGCQENEVTVNSKADPDYDHDFVGRIVGYKDNGAMVSVLDQDDNVCDVLRSAIKFE